MSRRARKSDRALREKPRASRPTWVIPTLLLVLASLALVVGVQRVRRPPVFDPALPADLSAFDPTLASRIKLAAEEVRKTPSSAEAHANLGYLYEAHNYRDYAAEAYRRASLLDANNPRWLYLWATTLARMGPSEEILPALKRVLTLSPDYAPAHEALGLQYLDRGDLESAAQSFQAALSLTANRCEAYLHLAGVRLSQRRFAEAVVLVEKAVELPPERPDAYYLLGRAYRGLGRHAEADAAFARSHGVDSVQLPDPWRAPVNQARATHGALFLKADELMATGRLAEAIVVLEKLHRDAPENVDYISNLATAYLESQRVNDAIPILERGIALRPDFFPLRINMAAAMMAKGNLEKALEHAHEATVLAPSVGKGFYTKGLILARMGRTAAALESLIEAKKVEPKDPNVRSAMGELHAQLQQWEAAASEFEAALVLNPKSALLHYNVAIVYSNTERNVDAVRHLEEAARLEPKNQRIAQALERARARLEGR